MAISLSGELLPTSRRAVCAASVPEHIGRAMLAAGAAAVLTLAACVREPVRVSLPATQTFLSGVSVTASVTTDTMLGVLRARARFTNSGATPAEFSISTDWCALVVRAYSRNASSPQPVWSSDRPPAPGAAPVACGHVLRQLVLAPGTSQDFEAAYRPRFVLGHDLPKGTYDFGVVVELVEPRMTTREVFAGSVVIDR
jgi:hypothetical protein